MAHSVAPWRFGTAPRPIPAARPFVFEPGTGFLGRLPEGPELRNATSVVDYTAMERARTLFIRNCAEK